MTPDGDVQVPRWVRLGMVVVLAVPQLLIGLWALLAPHRFFDRFPGFDPRLVASIPPYNAHLTSDAGAGFFATGVALVVAAAWGGRRVVQLALITLLAFAVPHVLYHLLHQAPGLSSGEDVANVLVLAAVPVWALVFGWGSTRPAAPA